MKKKYWLLIIFILIVLIPFVKPAYNNIKLSWRMKEVLNFPSDGYVLSDSGVTAEATIYILSKNPENNILAPTFIVDVGIINNSEKTLKSMTAAAKINPKIKDYYTKYGYLLRDIARHGLFDLPPPGNPNVGHKAFFSRNFGMNGMSTSEQDEIRKYLRDPVYIKVVHDGGTILLKTVPTIVVK